MSHELSAAFNYILWEQRQVTDESDTNIITEKNVVSLCICMYVSSISNQDEQRYINETKMN